MAEFDDLYPAEGTLPNYVELEPKLSLVDEARLDEIGHVDRSVNRQIFGVVALAMGSSILALKTEARSIASLAGFGGVSAALGCTVGNWLTLRTLNSRYRQIRQQPDTDPDNQESGQ